MLPPTATAPPIQTTSVMVAPPAIACATQVRAAPQNTAPASPAAGPAGTGAAASEPAWPPKPSGPWKGSRPSG
jgi:hypothetical protein